MIKFFNFLIHSNLFISLCAASLYFLFALKSEVNFSLTNVLFIFSGTYLGYHLLRLVPLLKEHFVAPEFIQYYQKYKIYNYITLILALTLSLYCLLTIELYIYPVLVLSMILLGTYEKIILPKFALRELPYIKPIIIALVWTLLCTQIDSLVFNWNVVDCFIFVFLLSIPFDIKDISSDKSQAIKTLPMLFKDKGKFYLTILYSIYAMVSFYYLNESFFLISIPIYYLALKFADSKTIIYYLGFDGLILLRYLLYLQQY